MTGLKPVAVASLINSRAAKIGKRSASLDGNVQSVAEGLAIFMHAELDLRQIQIRLILV